MSVSVRRDTDIQTGAQQADRHWAITRSSWLLCLSSGK